LAWLCFSWSCISSAVACGSIEHRTKRHAVGVCLCQKPEAVCVEELNVNMLANMACSRRRLAIECAAADA